MQILTTYLGKDIVSQMKILSLQQVLLEKEKMIKQIKGLSTDAQGRCIHVGKLSPGCAGCFLPRAKSAHINIRVGTKCNLSCPYCTSDMSLKDESSQEVEKNKANILSLITQRKHHLFSAISFSGGGEPLLYKKIILDHLKLIRPMMQALGQEPWYYFYTNGTLATKSDMSLLKNAGIKEIRFHIGASAFSEKTFTTIEQAVSIFDTVSIETPAWPPHSKKLLAMLPRLQTLGVKHLNIGEIEVNRNNLAQILKKIPKAKIYACYEYHLYDEGLVYDLIAEHIRQKYSFSILDCNSLVKLSQRGPAKDLGLYIDQKFIQNS